MVGGWVGPPGSPEVSSLVLEKKFRAPLEWIHGALSRIQFTTHFIKNSVVEMKRFVGSFENVISCTAALQTQVPKLCTDLDLSLLYILIFGTCTKFARKNNFLALGDCFPQPCSSAGRRFAASRSRLQNYRRIVSFPQKKNRWNVLETGFHWESAFVWEIPNPSLNGSKGREFNLGFRNSVFWYPGIIKWKRPKQMANTSLFVCLFVCLFLCIGYNSDWGP